jgi:RHS repeat-associated protein
LGRCVKRWISPSSNTFPNGATYLYYDGWNLIQEGPTGSAATRVYAHGNRVDEVVADYSYNDNQFRYHHYDARRNCILLTNQSGNLIEQYDYDAFGQPYFYNAIGQVRTETAEGNRFLFTGREWLSELRGYDYRNRLYIPQLGRFLQPDPKHFLAGDYNLYRYCHNDPVNCVDPDGLYSWGEFLTDSSNFSAGIGDNISFGVTARIRESLPGIYGDGGGVDKGSGAYVAGGRTGTGLVLATGVAGGIKIAGARLAAAGERAVASRVMAKVERQLAEHGEKSLQRSLRSFDRRIAEHKQAIRQYKEQGGHTSSLQREMRAFEQERNAIKELLKKKNE